MSDTLFAFLLIIAASFGFSTLLSKIPLLRIPAAVSYLLFGMVLHTGIVPLPAEELQWLNHLAAFGLLFLMYISGMEVGIRQLLPHKAANHHGGALTLGLSIFCATLLLSFAFSIVIARYTPPPTNPYMLALLFSTTSLGVILPILEESGLLHTDLGQTLLVSALIADFLTMLLLSLFISSQSADSWQQTLLTLAIIPFALAMFLILRALQHVARLRRLAGDMQARIRAVVALLALTCALAEFTGPEPILGSFLVGMLVSAMSFSDKDRLRDYSHGIGYGFFIPLFFISVGLDFNFDAIRSSGVIDWIPVLALLAFAVKILPALQLRRLFGTRTAIASGFLLSARLSLIAAAAQIGVQIGMMARSLADAVILVAIVTSLVSPIAFVTLAPSQPRTG